MFFYLNPLSCATDTEDLHCAKLCGAGAFLCTPRSVFSLWFSEIPKASPHGQGEPGFLFLPTPGDGSRNQWRTVPTSGRLRHRWCWPPSSPMAFPGCWARCRFWGLPRASGLEATASCCVAPAAVRKAVQETRREGCRQDRSRRRLPLTSQPFSSPKPAAPTPPPKAPAADGDGLARAARPPAEPLGHRWPGSLTPVGKTTACAPSVLRGNRKGRLRKTLSFLYYTSFSIAENIGKWRFSHLLQEFSPMFPLDHLLPDLGCINKTMWTYFIVINLTGWSASNDHSTLAFVTIF